jgi:hypothetical protein
VGPNVTIVSQRLVELGVKLPAHACASRFHSMVIFRRGKGVKNSFAVIFGCGASGQAWV